jgi:hypothetical protein
MHQIENSTENDVEINTTPKRFVAGKARAGDPLNDAACAVPQSAPSEAQAIAAASAPNVNQS